MSATDLVRAAAVRTNRYWPFSQLNRLAYGLALRAFLSHCTTSSAVRSVYLRHGLVQRDWVPGLSDIDLTITFDGGLSEREEWAFARDFWRRQQRLQPLVPMVRASDISLISEAYLESWTSLGIKGYEARTWKLVRGRPNLRGAFPPGTDQVRDDAFDYGLSWHEYFLLPWTWDDARQTPLRHLEMQRLARKVRRYASYDRLPEPCCDALRAERPDRFAVVACAIRGLDQSIRDICAASRRESGAAEWTEGVGLPAAAEGEAARALRNAGEETGALEAAYLVDQDRIAVLRDDLPCAAIRGFLERLKRTYPPGDAPPLVVSARVLEQMLRWYRPFLYWRWARHREIAHGRDVMAENPPPSVQALVRDVLAEVPRLLSFAQRAEVVHETGMSARRKHALDGMLWRALLARLYLEDGIIHHTRFDLVKLTRARYPEPYRVLRELEERPEVAGDSARNQALFRLFRDLARDVDRALTRWRGDQTSPSVPLEISPTLEAVWPGS